MADSFRVRNGVGCIAEASRGDIAKILGLRLNSVALRRGLKILDREKDQRFTCVGAVELLLRQAFARIGLFEFEGWAHESIATVFWHAISRNQGSLALIGSAERTAQILQKRLARFKLADELTGRPSIHRFIYRASNGNAASALDRYVLKQNGVSANDVIDLEEIAELLVERIGRPILSLELTSR